MPTFKKNIFFQDKTKGAKPAAITEEITKTLKVKEDEVDAQLKPKTLKDKKAAAAAFIGQKLNANVDFQKFNQNLGT